MPIPSIYDATNAKQVQSTVNQLVRQFDNTGKFDLPPNATTITVQNGKVNPNSVVTLAPNSDNAIGATWSVTYTTGSFTAKFGQAVTTVRTFRYAIHGV